MKDVAAIEAVARAALPAVRDIAVPGWVVRVSGGPTKRVNSANPVAPGAALADVVAPAEAAYAAHGLPARFRLTPLADVACDSRLADRGYAMIDESWTMIAPLKRRAHDTAVGIASRPDAAWLAGLADALGWTVDQRDAHAALLARIAGTVAIARIVDDGRALAFGIGSIVDDCVCLFDIAVARHARRRGLGRRLVATVLGWAADRTATHAVLQVLDANGPARALYRSLGFVDAYRYHYRVR